MFKNTLNKRLIIVTLSIAIPFILLIFWWGLTEQKRIRYEEISKSQKEIDITVSQMDSMLELLENSIVTIVMNDTDLVMAASQQKESTDFWLANQKVAQKLKNLMSVSSINLTPFIYYKESDIFYNNKVNISMTDFIKNQISKKDEISLIKGWQTVWVDNRAYLYIIIEYQNYYLGVWGDYNSYYTSVLGEDTSILDDENYNFVDSSGKVIEGEVKTINLEDYTYVDEEGTEWDIVIAPSGQIDCNIVKLIRKNSKIQSLTEKNNEVLIVAILFVIIFVVYIIFIYRWIVFPMNHIRRSIKKIQNGNVEFQIEEIKNTSAEFDNIIKEFNFLMLYVKNLKIEMYENKLAQNEVQLQYLSRQIHPHFILNTLNTIYNYVSEDPELAKEIIKQVSKYYRYVIGISSKYVALEDELDHIDNYLKLQKNRYGSLFNYKITYDKKLRKVPVLAFIIESFVGNSIKHGIRSGEVSQIFVEVSKTTNASMKIRVSDTGKGFNDDDLDAINEYLEKDIVSEELGIGIKNSIERLRLAYGDKFTFNAYNNKPYGAVVEIDINLEEMKYEC